MISKNIIERRVLRIAFITMVIVLLLQYVNYAGANTTQQINNASPEIGVTYTQEVPFSIESIAEVKVHESNQPAYIPERRVIPFHKEPPPKELKPGTTPLKPQSPLQYEPTTSSLAPVLSSSLTGLLDNGKAIPPDTMGAAGPSHLVEILNTEVGFFNKSTGALISNVSLKAFWSSLGTGSGQPDNFPFDPKVIYDQNSGRFIAVTMGGTSSPGSWLMIAVSNTSDPTGTWYKLAIAADNDSGVHLFDNWADYPGFGVDTNYVYVTANMFSNTGSYQYGKVWVIPKTQLLNGNDIITWTEFRAPTGSGTIQPAYVLGSSSTEYLIDQGYFISVTPPRRFLNINSITFPGGTPTWTNLGYIEVSSYPTSSIPSAPQLGNSTLIDTGDARLLNAVFRNGYLWTTHTVANSANTKTEVGWYQINPATASPSSPYGTPVQQGRISDANRWYYYPSIAVNSNGDVGIGFSGSSTSEYAGAYYTARNSSDTAGTMQSVALLKAGLASYYKTFSGTRNRWGDYSATVVDPGDNTTFWTLQEYAGTSNLWGTWWGKFAPATVTPSLSISASTSTVTVGVPISVIFTVTSVGVNISGAAVTLGSNATGSGTTDTNGNATISVNATGAGTITATATKAGYTSASTTITASVAFAAGDNWVSKTSMPTARSNLYASQIGGLLYVAGGHDGSGATNKLEVYDPTNDTWSAKTSILHAVYQGAVGVIDNRLYVVGGWDYPLSGIPTSVLQIYDPGTNTWSTGADMPILSGCSVAGVINRKLYVLTACDGFSGYRKYLHVYDPDNNSWTQKSSPPSTHAYAGGGVIDGKFYVIGGFDESNTIAALDVYDPITDTWVTKASMPTARQQLAAGVVDGKLYAVGGSDGTKALATLEVYDPATNAWTANASMTTARSALAADVINGKLYAVGGSDGTKVLATLEVYSHPTLAPTPSVKGNDTVGIYQNSTGTFFLRNNNSAGASDISFQFGPGGLTPIKGDYDGSGNDTAGVYNAGTGTFYLKNSNNAGAADTVVQYGPGGSDFLPMLGDWDGSGNGTLGIYRVSTGTFFLKNSNNAGAADTVVQYGPGGSDFLPVVGDWDGSGNDTIGIYKVSAGTFYLKNSNSAGAADTVVQYGPGGSDFLPVIGDWNGDGTDTIGLYRISTGTFFLKNSNSAGAADTVVQYGPGGSDFLPMVGDWDGQ